MSDWGDAHGPISTSAAASDAFAREQLALAAAAIACVVFALAIAVLARRGALAGATCVTLATGAIALSAAMLAGVAGRPPTPVRTAADRFDVVYVAGAGEYQVYVPAQRRVTLLVVSHLSEPSSLVAPSLGLRADLPPQGERTLTSTVEREGVVRLYASTASGDGASERPRSSDGLLPHRPSFVGFVGWGAELYEENGCPACHSTTPERGSYGPSLANVAGSSRRLESGQRVRADLRYLAASLTDPEAARVDGFRGRRMPSFAGLGELKNDALVAYLVSLSYVPTRPSLCEAWSDACGTPLD